MKKIYIPVVFVLILLGILSIFKIYFSNHDNVDVLLTDSVIVDNAPSFKFEEVLITTDHPGSELVNRFGSENTRVILSINRIDDTRLKKGMKLIAPLFFDDSDLWLFMPKEISMASDIPKLVILSLRTQAFGFYENGKLVRGGPISSGKKSTPTEDGLYFTNWKGKEVVSTFDDKWILKWNFNIENEKGISLHQYSMPGFPASHSCVRMYEQDAKWLYEWADQWILSPDGKEKVKYGTPVIIYGSYDFDKDSPWKMLASDSNATNVSQSEISDILNQHIAEINAKK